MMERLFLFLSIAGVVAATYGSNSTYFGYDAGGNWAAISTWKISNFAPSISTFEELPSPASSEIKSATQVASYPRSWPPLQYTASSSPAPPARRLPPLEGRGTYIAEQEAEFQPTNVSFLEGIPRIKPYGSLYRGSGYTSGSGNEDDNDPPPKPQSSKSLGKRRRNPSFDADREDENTSGFEGHVFDSHFNLMGNSDLSARWLRHLRSAISTAPEVEEPEHSSSSYPVYITALTGAAFCLVTTQSSDRKRKKQKTSQGESSASGSRRAQFWPAASTSNAFNYCNSSTPEMSEILTGKTFQHPKNSGSIPKWGDSSSIDHLVTRPVSQEELVAEVRGIYAGLAMVERNCTAIDQKTEIHPCLSNHAWKALIGLHRLLLHEHHDLFVASVEKFPLCHLYDAPENFCQIPTCCNPSVGHGNFEANDACISAISEQESSYEGSTDIEFESSNPSPDEPDRGSLDISVDKLSIDSRLNSFGPTLSNSLNTPESATGTHTPLSFEINEIFDSWSDPFPETTQMNIPDIRKPEDPPNPATDLGLEPDEEWLRSFVDLEMCSNDSWGFVPERTSHNGFVSQLELPVLHAPVPFTEGSSYIEPYLTVMTQCDQTNGRQQELDAPSLSSPNPDIEELQSSISPLVPSLPTSQSSDSPLPLPKVDALPRRGVPKECIYCHKSFPRSELKKHIKYHTKPVSCPEPDCKYACANDHDLKRHHQTNHGEVQRQKCLSHDCKVTFTRRYNLLRHMRKVHGGESNNSVEPQQKA